jgi:hypothetical protein
VPDATQPAVRTGTVCTTDPDYCNPPATAAVPGWAQCPEYYQMALDVGWPESQMRTVMYVMNRESRCNPGATGSNVHGKHAQGLMQLLGWSCPPNGCYDPWSNLSKALDLWQSSGWRPWCLRGDRVTGSC